MNSPVLRLGLAASAVVAGVIAGAFGAWVGWFFLLVSCFLLWLHLRDGGVAAAFEAFKAGDLEGVRRALGFVWWPSLLSLPKQAYRLWMEGVILAADCRFAEARQTLLQASSGAIQTENDRSLIQCLLAEVSYQMNDVVAARDHYRLAQRLDHHEQVDRMIAQGIARLGGLAVRGAASDTQGTRATY